MNFLNHREWFVIMTYPIEISGAIIFIFLKIWVLLKKKKKKNYVGFEVILDQFWLWYIYCHQTKELK